MEKQYTINPKAILELNIKEAFLIGELLSEALNSEEHFNNPLFLKLQDKIDNTFLINKNEEITLEFPL